MSIECDHCGILQEAIFNDNIGLVQQYLELYPESFGDRYDGPLFSFSINNLQFAILLFQNSITEIILNTHQFAKDLLFAPVKYNDGVGKYQRSIIDVLHHMLNENNASESQSKKIKSMLDLLHEQISLLTSTPSIPGTFIAYDPKSNPLNQAEDAGFFSVCLDAIHHAGDAQAQYFFGLDNAVPFSQEERSVIANAMTEYNKLFVSVAINSCELPRVIFYRDPENTAVEVYRTMVNQDLHGNGWIRTFIALPNKITSQSVFRGLMEAMGLHPLIHTSNLACPNATVFCPEGSALGPVDLRAAVIMGNEPTNKSKAIINSALFHHPRTRLRAPEHGAQVFYPEPSRASSLLIWSTCAVILALLAAYYYRSRPNKQACCRRQKVRTT